MQLRGFSPGPFTEFIDRSFARYGTAIDDSGLLSRLLRTGDFCIFIDGLYESDMDEEIRDFAVRFPEVRIVTTSQPPAPSPDASTYTLPEIGPDLSRRLLKNFLAETETIVDNLDTIDLPNGISSAYDLKLIASLITAGEPIPATRLNLYKSLFDFSMSGEYPRSPAYRKAWEIWLTGARQFETDEKLTASLLTPLLNLVVVARGVEKFEFVHDLMRSFLAASWITDNGTSHAGIVIERLSESAVWKLSREEQEDVCDFIAEFTQSQTDMTELVQFA